MPLEKRAHPNRWRISMRLPQCGGSTRATLCTTHTLRAYRFKNSPTRRDQQPIGWLCTPTFPDVGKCHQPVAAFGQRRSVSAAFPSSFHRSPPL